MLRQLQMRLGSFRSVCFCGSLAFFERAAPVIFDVIQRHEIPAVLVVMNGWAKSSGFAIA
jgi:hypothetical protein